MDSAIKSQLLKWMPVASFLLSLVVAIGGAYVSIKMQAAITEVSIANLQRDQARHELEKSEQIRAAMQRADDHEKRIVKLEANFGLIQDLLSEMKGDIKILMRGATHN